MQLSELKILHVSKLLDMASELAIENANRMRKQELIYAILKAKAKNGDTIYGDGTLEVLQSQQPVLVDYWAEWCGPCKMIAPILDEIAAEYAGKLKVAKVNIDDNQATPAKFGIRGIPTLMIFKNGNVEATKVGALSKSQLAAFIDSNL